MKKLFVLMFVAGVMTLGFNLKSNAQDATPAQTAEPAAVATPAAQAPAVTETADVPEGEKSFHQVVKEQFIAGGIEFMFPILACFVFGLAIILERIITLNMATTNTKKLLARVDEALAKDGIEGAKEVCKNTKGPVASIFTQGLMRMSEGIDMVEKSIVSYGSVEMGRLERGLVWVSLFISVAPMLGFLGTVVGMVFAFDAIAAANDINPALVETGIKIAIITTFGGIFVAIILLVLYNYLVSKIDSLVNQMEDASITLIDMLVRHNLSK